MIATLIALALVGTCSLLCLLTMAAAGTCLLVREARRRGL